ncbi:LolA family protein [Sphaerisporangium rhizosphaerae]|uniref:Outer membrane lipoprotein carrier protein LolA n=1 Tax=Sphaerisporangium rhizosphaerae TaxID=2269375 RepID=A0ABW2P459_9ACTN
MRWGVPIAAVVVVGAAVGTGPVIAAVQGDPALPERTAQQLLAEVAKNASRAEPPAMSGTVVETASLGLPALPATTGVSSSPFALLSGSHTLKVWYGGDDRVRLALPGQMSETDLISTGHGEAWLWQSGTNTATRYKLDGPAGAHAIPTPSVLPTARTPEDLAGELLKAAGQDTAVGVENGQHVAGRAAYQLVLTPKVATSLVGKVTVALDGETYIPLRVQVYAKGTAEPAFEVGFTQVAFTTPAPENFAFTPPAGAKVEDKTFGAGDGGPGDEVMATAKAGQQAKAGARTHGTGWGTIAELPFSPENLAPSTPSTPSKRLGAGKFGDTDPSKLADSLLKSAKRVSGPWGSGRVIESKLVSALLTDDGRLLIGAVTPEALTEAAGRR